jgi:inhibitor of cysteine peptidase
VTTLAAVDKAPESGATSIYTEDKQNISVTPDKPSFVIKLKSNPTTGYSWFLREYNPSIVTPVKHTFQPPEKSLIGAPGYELWTFRVKPAAFSVPQITTIRMTYARPWQSGDSSTQIVFHVTTMGK